MTSSRAVPPHVLLRHRDVPGIGDLAVYEAEGGYATARAVLTGMEPEAVVEVVKASGLRGRGGAGFPTGVKWGFLPKDGRPRVLVVNADESEPGTFKDREILEHNPHQLVEGILLAAYAIRAPEAFVYCRGEFRTGAEILERAVAAARARGYLGERIFGTSYSLTVHVYRGAGAYICGEETAQLESLEGRRGNPRLKPPFPAVSGLYGLPTVVNNVETIANLPPILTYGADWYRSMGTEKSPGVKVFSVSGQVRRPGNFERPLATPLRALIEAAGGLYPGRQLKAVIPGGSSVPLLPADRVDTPMDYESMLQAGSMLGSGGVIVLDDRTCIVGAAERLVRFYREESCGKCTPCREGTFWNAEILARLERGQGRMEDIDQLLDIADNMAGKCFCPLGDASLGFLVSALEHFRDEFVAHVTEKGCPWGATLYGAHHG
ncbi:NADH:ubiquinone oxidoreductase subunit F [Candidatus Hydrogenisulfobacillus filiaventi]|uniref:NADH-quinone oxidoreductase subunit F n=1 Tax=Candidatus Hydrogenisulfobacillus filiaventi TaxID=2707344 RepID=A0A6F8ZIB9_9FIRM|nr:NADH-quinone oxidoreductase subunit NuoF [Bacillota bacterium]CAB1129338.1 NADH:ubiquinone oxidoreductase subunit F [Candidatus Hydrogenisulfobacillus filiaventi]